MKKNVAKQFLGSSRKIVTFHSQHGKINGTLKVLTSTLTPFMCSSMLKMETFPAALAAVLSPTSRSEFTIYDTAT
jgi:hypothetical protein